MIAFYKDMVKIFPWCMIQLIIPITRHHFSNFFSKYICIYVHEIFTAEIKRFPPPQFTHVNYLRPVDKINVYFKVSMYPVINESWLHFIVRWLKLIHVSKRDTCCFFLQQTQNKIQYILRTPPKRSNRVPYLMHLKSLKWIYRNVRKPVGITKVPF